MNHSRTIFEMYDQIVARKTLFFGVFFIVILLTYGFLFAIDFIPEPINDEVETAPDQVEDELREDGTETGSSTPDLSNTAQFPISIHFDSLNRTIAVKNPVSRSIEALDAELLTGVVRHPDSADFQNPGNIFILGHSSYLPTVFNKNFQAFNGIQDLTWGDIIRLRSEDTEYLYRVERVYEAKASEVIVPNSRGEAKLTLATCNTFGAKEDRYIVEAVLTSKEVL